MPKKRLQDDIKLDAHAPAEEEQPFCTLTEKSGIHIFFFPKNLAYFDKYNIFKGISPEEKRGWQEKYVRLLKEIALFQGKDKHLLLKNPHNTGRVKELLELFPNAKFIFIHRKPYDVFRSTIHLYEKMVKSQFLQEFSDKEIEERVLYCYETTMAKYLSDRHLVPEGNLAEIPYERLSKEPMKEMTRIYDELSLPGFETTKPALQAYLDSVKGYKTNKFPDLSPELESAINKRWGFTFEEWGYEK